MVGSRAPEHDLGREFAFVGPDWVSNEISLLLKIVVLMPHMQASWNGILCLECELIPFCQELQRCEHFRIKGSTNGTIDYTTATYQHLI
jgi:hypothetical protein